MLKREMTQNSGDRHDEEKEKNGSTSPPGDPFLKYKIFKQISLVIVWICLGFYLEITGPALPDLKDRIGVDLEKISQTLVASSVGVFIGSFTGGILHERFYRRIELHLSLGLLVAAISTTCVPNVGHVSLVALCFFINGLTEGFINIGGNTILMHMWGEQAAAPMHSLHFGFGVGAIIAPQVVRPFLAPRNQGNKTKQGSIAAVETIYNISTYPAPTVESPIKDVSRIEFAFMIAGIVTLCCSVLWLVIYIRGPPRDYPTRQGSLKITRKMFSPATWARGDMLFGSFIMAVLFFFFIQAAGGQRAYGRFLFTFLVETDLQFSNTEAANLNSLFWGSFTAGRATGIPIANFVSTPVMIGIQAFAQLITCIIMAAAVFQNRLIVWIFSVPLGYFMAQVYPSGLAWSNIYLDMNSVSVMVLGVGASTGGILYQYLPGYLVKIYGQSTLLYVMVMYGICLVIAFVIMTLLARVYVRRNPKQVEEVEIEDAATAEPQDEMPLRGGSGEDEVFELQGKTFVEPQKNDITTKLQATKNDNVIASEQEGMSKPV